MNSEIYQELIIEHGTNPRNFKFLIDHNYHAEGYNPLCGDQITLYLSIQNQQIIQATFQGHGCAICMASASIMTEILMNQTIEQALKLFNNFTNLITKSENKNTPEDLLEIDNLSPKLLALLGVKNYPARVKCATLAWHTLNAALTNTDKDNKQNHQSKD